MRLISKFVLISLTFLLIGATLGWYLRSVSTDGSVGIYDSRDYGFLSFTTNQTKPNTPYSFNGTYVDVFVSEYPYKYRVRVNATISTFSSTNPTWYFPYGDGVFVCESSNFLSYCEKFNLDGYEEVRKGE